MSSISINGFTYKWDNQKGAEILHSCKTPQTFYKYYALNEYSVDALVNMYIYASHPNQLNDLLDCHKDIVVVDDPSTIKNLLGPFEKNARSIYDENGFLEFANKAFKTILSSKLGVLSLASSCDNEVMWAHYAQNNGFCLEFDVNEFPFKCWGPYPINYLDELPAYKTSEKGIQIPFLVQCYVKRNVWSYENEWRMLIQSPEGVNMRCYNEFGHLEEGLTQPFSYDRKFKYPLMALKSVRLAPHFFKNCCSSLTEINPMEVNITVESDTLVSKVLSFLYQLQTQYPLKVYCSQVKLKETMRFYQVTIIKLNEENYRLIEIID